MTATQMRTPSSEDGFVPMRLIGVGPPRTATSSQKVALDTLGLGPCYHMQNLFADLDEVPRWRRALDDPSGLEEILATSQSTTDWPASYHWRSLVDLYPEAKLLLSTRDPDSWARSMHTTIWAMLYGDGLLGHVTQAHCDVDPRWGAYIEMCREMWDRSGLLRGRDSTHEQMRDAYIRFNNDVISTVDPQRLLVWTISDGWDPLCEFLDLPVPDSPFPQVNDTAQFESGIVGSAVAALRHHLGDHAGDVAVAHPGASTPR